MELNKEQENTVISKASRINCVAGPGSGKTRVIIHRIKHLIEQKKYSGHQILIVTFTRLAAGEIRHRLEKLIPEKEVWKIQAGTFHSICYKMLKQFGSELGYRDNITVYDEEDSRDILNQIIKDLSLKISKKELNEWLYLYDSGKKSFDDLLNDPKFESLTNEYWDRLKSQNAVDYTLILMETILLLKHQYIKEYYQNKWKHVLVDEFHDTNHHQFEFLKAIDPENLFVISDEDQNIYQWRGSDPTICLNFQNHYPDTEMHFLTRNYRSYKPIVEAANNLIKHNIKRFDKTLWTDKKGIILEDPKSWNDIEMESIAVCRDINNLVNGITEHSGDMATWTPFSSTKPKYSDIAILSRVNWLLEIYEQKLNEYEIPVQRISREREFYKKEHIKRCLDLFRVYLNEYDIHSFKRLLAWDIWDQRLTECEILEAELQALKEDKTLYQVCKENHPEFLIFETIENVKAYISSEIGKSRNAYTNASYIITELQLKEKYIEKGLIHRANDIDNLFDKISKWIEETGSTELSEFLNDITFQSLQDEIKEDDDTVKLMTIHAAKGLEFKVVYIIGCAEGMFPLKSDEQNIEEARRLMYVAITRAENLLKISYPRTVTRYRKNIQLKSSRFLTEMR